MLVDFFPSISLISSYLRREFLQFFFLCLSLFLGLSLFVDFFDRLKDFIKYAAPPSAILRYFFFKAPLFVTQAAPAAALTASLLSLGLLSRHKEILALKSCGISSLQIARPIVLAAGVLSIAVWGWNEFIVPYAFHMSRYINTVEIKGKTFKGLFHEQGFWYHGAQAFYHIDHFDSRKNILFGLTIYTLDGHFRLRSLVEASQARWHEGQWHFENLRAKSLYTETTLPALAGQIRLPEKPEDFALVDMEADEFSSQQLRTHIADLQRKGLETIRYQVDLELKGAVPLATLAMALIGIALVVPGAKQLTLPTALGLSLIVGFSYWIFLALTVSLGHSGALSPFFAAWLANGVAFLLGIFFFLGVD
jgi:lipopolysaccharide export system permease protein